MRRFVIVLVGLLVVFAGLGVCSTRTVVRSGKGQRFSGEALPGATI